MVYRGITCFAEQQYFRPLIPRCLLSVVSSVKPEIKPLLCSSAANFYSFVTHFPLTC